MKVRCPECGNIVWRGFAMRITAAELECGCGHIFKPDLTADYVEVEG